MDNKIIITAALTIIASGIVAPFCKSIFDKIFASYNPDPKKISLGIKNISLFILRYAVLIGLIIYIFQSNNTFDKNFVMQLCIAFSLLILTIFFEFLYKLFGSNKSVIFSILNYLKENNESNVSTRNLINKVLDVNAKLIDKNLNKPTVDDSK